MNKFHFTIVGVPPQTRPCPDPSISGGPPSLQCTLAPAHVLQASVLLEGGQHQLSWMSGKHGWESASPCAWGGSLWVYSPALPGGSGYPPSLHQGGGPPHLPTQAHRLSSAIQALSPPDSPLKRPSSSCSDWEGKEVSKTVCFFIVSHFLFWVCRELARDGKC